VQHRGGPKRTNIPSLRTNWHARGKGFPRFRARARYHAADFRVGDGLTLRICFTA
jgi:hypothetical protein